VKMLTNTARVRQQLNRTFNRVLSTAIAMLFIAIIGGVVALFSSSNVGYLIFFTAVVIGIICLIRCAVLRALSRPTGS
jgi:hypothetical protein